MKFTILMPVYNAGKFLDKSIGSVKNQSYQEWELMCVDDGSSDDSLERLNAYAQQDERIKVLQTPRNMGPMGARRIGFEKSTGDYIVYLDADDCLSDDYLSSINHRIKETGAELVFPDLVHVDIRGGRIRSSKTIMLTRLKCSLGWKVLQTPFLGQRLGVLGATNGKFSSLPHTIHICRETTSMQTRCFSASCS